MKFQDRFGAGFTVCVFMSTSDRNLKSFRAGQDVVWFVQQQTQRVLCHEVNDNALDYSNKHAHTHAVV